MSEEVKTIVSDVSNADTVPKDLDAAKADPPQLPAAYAELIEHQAKDKKEEQEKQSEHQEVEQVLIAVNKISETTTTTDIVLKKDDKATTSTIPKEQLKVEVLETNMVKDVSVGESNKVATEITNSNVIETVKEVQELENFDESTEMQEGCPKELNQEYPDKELKAVENSEKSEVIETNPECIEQETKLTEKLVEENYDDLNDSQDSVDLVIDEKSGEHELPEDENSPDSVAPMETEDGGDSNHDIQNLDKKQLENPKESEAKDDEKDEKDSCEDTSEMSVVTQIDAAELDSDADKKNAQIPEVNKGEEKKDDKDDEVQIMEDPSATQIIEIDDEADEEEEEEVQKQARKSSPVKETNEVQVQECASKENDEKQSITVIEIDDEDEDETTTDLSSSTKEETKANEQKNTNLGEATNATIAPMEVDDSEQDKIPAEENQNKDQNIEMKSAVPEEGKPIDDADTKETAVPEADDSLLEESVTHKPTSPAAIKEAAAIAADSNLDDDVDTDVFYAKECINYECPRDHKQYFRAPQFTLSYFKVAKKKFKIQFICSTCYDKALDMYEEFCGLLTAKQPLLLKDIVGGRQEFVEIIDSSDEEDNIDSKTDKEKEHPSFSVEDRELIEAELENSIKRVLDKVEIQNQLTWSKTLLATRARRLQEENQFIDEELRQLQRKADNMHVSLYQCPKIKIRQLQPLDLNSGRPYTSEMPQLPPVGEIYRPAIQINEAYYAVKNKAIASWVPCKVSEQVDSAMGTQKNLKHYKIKFLKSQYQMLKTVSVKHLAYYNAPQVRLPIGTRVIAYFDATAMSRGKEKMMIQSAFYPGIIAEPLKPNNKYRYLIFYDDGYTQYVFHKDVRLVCHVSENVWEDVHPGSRDFIQKYLTQYSINRPMVQTQKGQSMTTESNGKWIYARVVDIDCSLIQMQFEGPKSHTEWIYRGSMRLGPVFKEYQKTLQKDAAMPISRLPRRTEPFIRYTEDEETTSTQKYWNSAETTRAVAKKSVSQRQQDVAAIAEAIATPTSITKTQAPAVSAASAAAQTVRHLNNSTIYLEDENKPKGKVVYYTAKRNLPPKSFRPHKCTPECLYKITHNLSAYSPLSKPLLSGWERLIIRQKIKKVVTYRSPCGKIQRNMKELRQYLRQTENTLNVDNFDFNHETNCLAEYVIETCIVQKRDISGGQEKMAIPLVNYYDSTMPPECSYAAQRIPTEGVNLELSEEFLVGCDCEDDCSDKTKCSCWQLTYAGAKYGNPNTPVDEIGYQYKRLYEHVPTGIYECNSRCKCKSNCLNRVVQHSLQMKLQVFKTSNRGWGLRCLNDVPRGSFICIYAGHLLTEAKANEGGLDAGDEYFAELDYIEVAEQIKEGYESEVEPPEPEEEEDAYVPEPDEDEEFTPTKYVSRKNKTQRLTRGSNLLNNEDDSQERQVINFNPNADMNENSVRESSIRQLFGRDEACYVMDAKTIGNLGRYFNHSCSPNLFVQNVFVDTHDLRFPWVAFFALTHIRAGTELTWNYNYEVGVVPGKVLYCQCGAPNCRLRLL